MINYNYKYSYLYELKERGIRTFDASACINSNISSKSALGRNRKAKALFLSYLFLSKSTPRSPKVTLQVLTSGKNKRELVHKARSFVKLYMSSRRASVNSVHVSQILSLINILRNLDYFLKGSALHVCSPNNEATVDIIRIKRHSKGLAQRSSISTRNKIAGADHAYWNTNFI